MSIENIKNAWLHKWHILGALLTLYFSGNKQVRQAISGRRKICQSNACGHFDKSGTHENIVWKGKPGCDICGCRELLKTAYLPGYCALRDIGEKELWAELIVKNKPPQ